MIVISLVLKQQLHFWWGNFLPSLVPGFLLRKQSVAIPQQAHSVTIILHCASVKALVPQGLVKAVLTPASCSNCKLQLVILWDSMPSPSTWSFLPWWILSLPGCSDDPTHRCLLDFVLPHRGICCLWIFSCSVCHYYLEGPQGSDHTRKTDWNLLGFLLTSSVFAPLWPVETVILTLLFHSLSCPVLASQFSEAVSPQIH